MKNAKLCLGAALVVSLFCLCALTAGVVYEIEVKDHSAGTTEESEMSVEGKNLKMEVKSGSGGKSDTEMIFRGDRREMVVVNHRDKSYVVIDEGTIQRLGGQISQARKEMEKRLAELDPKQREMMEKMLKGRMGSLAGGEKRPAAEVKRSGERSTHNGYPCVRYDVLREGRKIRELWVTDWSVIEGGREVADAFKEMADFYGDMMDSFGEMAGASGGFFNSDDDPMEAFAQVDGFPVVTRSFEGGELDSETTLKSSRRQTLDPDAFEPPAGYKRQPMGPQ